MNPKTNSIRPLIIFSIILLICGFSLSQTTPVFSISSLGFTNTPAAPTSAPTPIPNTPVPPRPTIAPNPPPPSQPEEEDSQPAKVLPHTGNSAVLSDQPIAEKKEPLTHFSASEQVLMGSPFEVSPLISIRLRPNEVYPIEVSRYNGTYWEFPKISSSAFWLENSAIPGVGGNTVLAGHLNNLSKDDGPFYHLPDIRIDDYIWVDTHMQTYAYQVREKKWVTPDDLSVTLPTDGAQLTLITCAGWDSLNEEFNQRLVIIADRVK